jgi:hypothetical protein
MFSESLLNDIVIFIFVRLPTRFQHVTVVLTISGGSIKIEKWPHTEGYAWSARCDGLGGGGTRRSSAAQSMQLHTSTPCTETLCIMQSTLSEIVESWNFFNKKLLKELHKQKHKEVLHCGMNKDIVQRKKSAFIATLPDVFIWNILPNILSPPDKSHILIPCRSLQSVAYILFVLDTFWEKYLCSDDINIFKCVRFVVM